MSLIFVGAGLYDEKDISVKGLERAKESDLVFMETYTSKLFGTTKEDLEEFIGKEIIFLSREEVEKEKKPLDFADSKEVVFLVPGDALISTTHVDLRLEAIDEGIDTEIIHGASIFTAAPGLTGLQNYKFGKSATVTYKKRGEISGSAYDAIKQNKRNGLHTLLFLDIDEREDNYMSPDHALELLREVEEERGEEIVCMDTLVVVVSRAGSKESKVRCGEVRELINRDFGDPLHTLIFPGELHFREKEALDILS